jgi:hypothetical protein
MLKRLLRIALITLALLLIPLGLQLTIGTGVDGQGFNWTLSDFIIIGSLIFLVGVALDYSMRRWSKYKVAVASIIVLVFVYVWAELAVGIFTNLGS